MGQYNNCKRGKGFTDYCEFLRDRITELRLKKGIKSERELSRQLGKNELYIQHIVSGKQNVGLVSFFEICDYFKITPQEFFDPKLHNPDLVKEAMNVIKELPDEDIQQLTDFAKKLKKN